MYLNNALRIHETDRVILVLVEAKKKLLFIGIVRFV
jgi:hypothetical protein